MVRSAFKTKIFGDFEFMILRLTTWFKFGRRSHPTVPHWFWSCPVIFFLYGSVPGLPELILSGFHFVSIKVVLQEALPNVRRIMIVSGSNLPRWGFLSTMLLSWRKLVIVRIIVEWILEILNWRISVILWRNVGSNWWKIVSREFRKWWWHPVPIHLTFHWTSHFRNKK